MLGPVAEWDAWWRGHANAATEPIATAATHGFVLTVDQLRRLGVSRSAMRTHLRRGRRRPGHALGAALPIEEITDWFGVPVTTVARTLVDVARHDRRDAIMAVDTALRERLVTVAEIDAALAGAVGWPGVGQARAVLALGDPRAESSLESITRLALHDDGFPAPELQYKIVGYRVDFCWPAQRLILEADGRGKYSGDALCDEKRRELPFRRRGWRVERVVWDDVVRTWSATSAQLWTAFTTD